MTTFPETNKSNSDKNVTSITKITEITKNQPNLELDEITELQETPEPSEVSTTKTLIIAPTALDPGTSTTEEDSTKMKIRSKIRCNICRRKLNLATISAGKCSCENVYCGEHRMPENHKCTFDRKGKWREELIKRNPKIIAAKINKV